MESNHVRLITGIIIFSVVNGEISIANYPTMVILNTNKGDRINFSVIYIHVPNKAFLVPDSCRAWNFIFTDNVHILCLPCNV
jgi:hypothetical protein